MWSIDNHRYVSIRYTALIVFSLHPVPQPHAALERFVKSTKNWLSVIPAPFSRAHNHLSALSLSCFAPWFHPLALLPFSNCEWVTSPHPEIRAFGACSVSLHLLSVYTKLIGNACKVMHTFSHLALFKAKILRNIFLLIDLYFRVYWIVEVCFVT